MPQLIQIKLINGEPMGREVNPWAISNVTPMPGMNNFESYHAFEQSVTYHPAPGCTESDGVGADIVWQTFTCKVGGSGPFWLDVDKDTYPLYKSFEDFQHFYANPPRGWGDGIKTRQIWVLSQKIEVKEALSTIIQSALLHEIPAISKRTGISEVWLAVWHEVEIFYGDVQKKQTREELLLRLQSQYDLNFKSPPTH